MLIVLAFTLLAALFATPASAGGGVDEASSKKPVGVGSGGQAPRPGNAKARLVCGANSEGYLVGVDPQPRRQFIGNFLRCNDAGAPDPTTHNQWVSERNYQYCLTGFDVFRFYGPPGGSPTAWTRSEIGLENWCQETQKALFWRPHPEDAAGEGTGPAWGTATGINRQKQRWTRTTQFPTSNAPYQRDGSCVDRAVGVQGRTDPLAQYFDKSNPDYADFKGMRDQMFQIYKENIKDLGHDGALSVINSQRGPGGSLPTDGDSISYGDRWHCSSDMDFVAAAGDPETQFGTCYVPVERRARVFHRADAPSVKGYGYFVDGLGGARYSDQFGNRSGEYKEYRGVIGHIVRTGGGPGPKYTDAPTAVPPNNLGDRNAAAADAMKHAKCIIGTGANLKAAKTTNTVGSADGIELTVKVPEVLQVGGAGNPSRVEVVASAMTCNGRPCAQGYQRPTLAQLHFGAELEGVNGYEECESSRDTGCDFYTSYESPRIPANSTPPFWHTSRDRDMVGDEALTAWYYSASQRAANGKPAEAVRVKVTSGDTGPGARSAPWATYWQPRTETLSITTCRSTELPGVSDNVDECNTITIVRPIDPVEQPLPVTVKPGAGPWDLKVVGATNVPPSSVVNR